MKIKVGFFKSIAFSALFGYNTSKYDKYGYVKGLIMKSIKQYLSSSRLTWFVFGFLTAVMVMVSSGADQTPPACAIGPYQIDATDGGVYLLDTRSGQIWLRSVMLYYDLGTPQNPIYRSTQLDR